MSGVSVTVDSADLQHLLEFCGGDALHEAIARALTDAAHLAEGEVKSRTPVVTGNLQRSFQTDVSQVRASEPSARLASQAEYAWWIETGEDGRGRVMQSRPGGYRMVEEGARSVEGQLEGILSNIAAAIEEEWRS